MEIASSQFLVGAPWFGTVREFDSAVRRLKHLRTTVSVPDLKGDRWGKMFWGATIGGREITLSWEWGEVGDGLIALRHPMSVSSNAQLMAEDGTCMANGMRILYLNNAVHEINWLTKASRLKPASIERMAA